MATYSIEDAQKALISYNDKKRYLWLISVFMPVFPLMGVFIFYRTGVEWTLCLPLLLNYTLMPLLDWLIGSDSNNPPEELVPQLEADKYYRYLTYLTVPLHFVTLCIFAYVVGTNDLSWWSILVTAIIAGGYSGLGINTAHELGHKQTGIEKLLAKITLAVPAYGHFCVEHNRGHHVLVATPDDPASSRLGESIYAFTLREIPGTFKRGWELEKSRLQKQGKQAWSIDNEILQSYAISAVLQGALVYAFGWIMVPFLAVHNVWAWYQLTSANYIEHYGLLREKKDNGRYERCQPHHSWNANYIMSNLALFHLERHSDHHANPIRRYQSLRNFEDIPELPNGYYGMYLLAYIPWLWFKVMDHRVLELPHIQGDLSKVNICPSKRESIFAKYGSN
ncbi:alkane 1-monooxygenase [Porticoccaceae bacterium]|nr:alkane 1-monooxygenase [Porticoccaceae bacterium]